MKKNQRSSSLMSVFISDRHDINLRPIFFDQNNPKYKYNPKNELIYIRDFEAI